MPARHYLNESGGWQSWLLTTDHKRIGLLYLLSITVFFFLGGFFALLIRLELLTPASDLMTPDVYNRVFTMHGVIMVFFFLIPSIPATLGNFMLPIMIGAKDLAFPRINLLSWYIYVIGGCFALVALVGGGVDTGWTFYTPYSSMSSNSRVLTGALGVFISGFSSILTGLNFIVTVHRMRAPGMTWFRLPLFVWAHYATSLIMILGTPVVAITILLLAFERVLRVGIFDSTIGGDPVLFQHLFWFYSHPAVYIMVLPGMGIISEIVAAFSRKNIFGYSFIAFSSLAIAVIGFLVWGHHLFVAGETPYSALVFSILTYLVARAVGGQDVQLDRDAVQGLDLLRDADALRLRLHRPLPGRRPDGTFPRRGGPRHPRHRHLLRRGALPLHHGRRHADGVPGRNPLLVAEDDGPHVSRRMGEAERAAGVRRVQPDVLPAVHPGLPGHAAALRDVSAGVPGVQRAVDRRCHDPRRGLRVPDGLSALVAEIRARSRETIRSTSRDSSGRRRLRRRRSISIGCPS